MFWEFWATLILFDLLYWVLVNSKKVWSPIPKSKLIVNLNLSALNYPVWSNSLCTWKMVLLKCLRENMCITRSIWQTSREYKSSVKTTTFSRKPTLHEKYVMPQVVVWFVWFTCCILNTPFDSLASHGEVTVCFGFFHLSSRGGKSSSNRDVFIMDRTLGWYLVYS